MQIQRELFPRAATRAPSDRHRSSDITKEVRRRKVSIRNNVPKTKSPIILMVMTDHFKKRLKTRFPDIEDIQEVLRAAVIIPQKYFCSFRQKQQLFLYSIEFNAIFVARNGTLITIFEADSPNKQALIEHALGKKGRKKRKLKGKVVVI